MNHEPTDSPDDQAAPTFVQFRPSKPGPLVVIVPSIFGVSPDVEHCANRFSARGALVYAMDPFWRDGNGPLRIPEDGKRAMARLKRVSDADVLNDLLKLCAAGLGHERCNGKLILLGVCFGGRFVVKASHHVHTDGVAVWHGAGLLPELSNEALANTKVSLDFGAQDPLIPPAEVAAIQEKMSGSTATIRVHDHCGHGFTHWGTERCVPEAAEAAAKSVLALIDQLVGGN
ncbi:MAG: dienelactone hydrolase family protein [Myxococcota bacterium]|nr:dienelactone hydrolase family protein [Myxococcota bacterium]